MLLVAPYGRCGVLNGQGQLRGDDIAEFCELCQEFGVPGAEAGAQSGQIRAFRKGVKSKNIGEISIHFGGDLEDAGGLLASINLRIAFIREQHEIMLPGQLNGPLQHRFAGYCTLWIGR